MAENIFINMHDIEHDAGVLLAKLVAERCEEIPNSESVDEFCERLQGYTYASYQYRLDYKDLTPLPRGYSNVRVFDAHDGFMLGSAWHLNSEMPHAQAGYGYRVSRERPTAFTVGSICLCLPFEEVTAWRATRPLATSGMGTLDLAVDIDIRPRRAIVDGTPIPEHLLDFMNERARRRD